MTGGEVIKLFAQDAPPKFLDASLLKHGLKVATYKTRSSSEPQGYQWADLDDAMFNGDGFRSKAFVPKQYAKDPELFWYGLPQVGTYLKGQGVIDSDGTALLLDIALDPTNLLALPAGPVLKAATAGRLGLTRAGQMAKAFTWLSRGGEIEDAAKAVDRGIGVLEEAWRISSKGPEILEAAKSGNHKAIKRIVDGARKTGTLTAEQADELASLRANRKRLTTIFQHVDDIRRKGTKLTPADLRQPTLRESFRTGQMAPHPFGFIVPRNPLARGVPFKQRAKFLGEIVGWEFQDTKIYFPAGDIVSQGLDAVGAGNIMRIGEKEFAKDALRYNKVIEAEEAIRGQFKTLPKELRDSRFMPAWQTTMAIQAIKVANGTPLDHVSMGLVGPLDEKVLRGEYKRLHQIPLGVSLTQDDEFGRGFKEYVRQRRDAELSVQAGADGRSAMRRDVMLDGMVGELDDLVAANKMSAAVATAAQSQLHKIAETLSLKRLAWETTTPGQGLAARSSLINLMARTVNNNIRYTVKRAYGTGWNKRPVREAITDVMKSVLDHPDLWKLGDDGRYRLMVNAAQAREAGADFLAHSLDVAQRRKPTSGLFKHLSEEGLDEEVSYMLRHVSDALKVTGVNLLEARVVRGLLQNYFPRVFKPNSAFWKMVGKDVHLSAAMAQLFVGDDNERAFQKLMGESYGEFTQRAKAGRVTLQEVRRLTEKVAMDLERRGLGKFERDSAILLGEYFSASGNALLMSRLFNDLPRMSGFLTETAVETALGHEAASRIPRDAWGQWRRVMEWDDAPEEAKGIYRRVSGEVVGDIPGLSEEALRDEAHLKYLDAWARSPEMAKTIERESARLHKLAETDQLAAIRNGIRLIEGLRREEERVLSHVARLDQRALDLALKESELVKAAQGASLDARIAEWKSALAKYRGTFEASWSKLNEIEFKILQYQDQLEDISRHRVAQYLSGKKVIGGIRLKLNGKQVAFDPNWLLSGSFPEGLEGIKGVKDAAKKLVAEELAKELDSEVAKRLKAAVDKVKEDLDKMLVRLKEQRAASALRLSRRAEAIGKAAERTAKSAVKRVEALRAIDESLKAFEPGPQLLDIRRRFDKLFKPIAEQEARASYLARQGRKLGKFSVRGRLASVRHEIRERLVKEAERAQGFRRRSVWVFEPDFKYLQESFRLYELGQKDKFWRAYDLWNSRIKGVVLLGDIFHFNTLAVSSFLANPEDLIKALSDDLGNLYPEVDKNLLVTFWRQMPVIKGAVLGAGTGAAVGEMRGGDNAEVGTAALVGLLYGAVIGAAMKHARHAGDIAMNPENIETLMWMGLGGWTGRPDDRSIGIVNNSLRALANKWLSDSGTAGLGSIAARMAEGLDLWDETLWQTLHNGSKHYYFSRVWEKELPKLMNSEQWSQAFLERQFRELRQLPPEGGAPAIEQGPRPPPPPSGPMPSPRAGGVELRFQPVPVPAGAEGSLRARGFTEPVKDADGKITGFRIYVDPNLPEPIKATVLGHELVHVAFNSLPVERRLAYFDELRAYLGKDADERLRTVAKKWGLEGFYEKAEWNLAAAGEEVLADAGSLALMDPGFLKHLKDRADKLGNNAEGLALLKDYESLISKVKDWVDWVIARLKDLASFTALTASGSSASEARGLADIGKKIFNEYADMLDAKQLRELGGALANADPKFAVGPARKGVLVPLSAFADPSMSGVGVQLGWISRGGLHWESPGGAVRFNRHGLAIDLFSKDGMAEASQLAAALRKPVRKDAAARVADPMSTRMRLANAVDWLIEHEDALKGLRGKGHGATPRLWIRENTETGDLVIHMGNNPSSPNFVFKSGRTEQRATAEAYHASIEDNKVRAKELAREAAEQARVAEREAKGVRMGQKKALKASREAREDITIEQIAKELKGLVEDPSASELVPRKELVDKAFKRLLAKEAKGGKPITKERSVALLDEARDSVVKRIDKLQSQYQDITERAAGSKQASEFVGAEADLKTEARAAADEADEVVGGDELDPLDDINERVGAIETEAAEVDGEIADYVATHVADEEAGAKKAGAEVSERAAALMRDSVHLLKPDLREAWVAVAQPVEEGGRGLTRAAYAKELGKAGQAGKHAVSGMIYQARRQMIGILQINELKALLGEAETLMDNAAREVADLRAAGDAAGAAKKQVLAEKAAESALALDDMLRSTAISKNYPLEIDPKYGPSRIPYGEGLPEYAPKFDVGYHAGDLKESGRSLIHAGTKEVAAGIWAKSTRGIYKTKEEFDPSAFLRMYDDGVAHTHTPHLVLEGIDRMYEAGFIPEGSNKRQLTKEQAAGLKALAVRQRKEFLALARGELPQELHGFPHPAHELLAAKHEAEIVKALTGMGFNGIVYRNIYELPARRLVAVTRRRAEDALRLAETEGAATAELRDARIRARELQARAESRAVGRDPMRNAPDSYILFNKKAADFTGYPAGEGDMAAVMDPKFDVGGDERPMPSYLVQMRAENKKRILLAEQDVPELRGNGTEALSKASALMRFIVDDGGELGDALGETPPDIIRKVLLEKHVTPELADRITSDIKDRGLVAARHWSKALESYQQDLERELFHQKQVLRLREPKFDVGPATYPGDDELRNTKRPPVPPRDEIPLRKGMGPPDDRWLKGVPLHTQAGLRYFQPPSMYGGPRGGRGDFRHIPPLARTVRKEDGRVLRLPLHDKASLFKTKRGHGPDSWGPHWDVGPNPSELREYVAKQRHLMKQDLAKQIVHASNTIFGGLHWAEMLNNPQFQHSLRRFLLSPDWTLSRLEMTSSFVAQLDHPAKAAALGAGVGQAVELADAGFHPTNEDGERHGITGRGPVFGALGAVALHKWAQGIQKRMNTKGDVYARKAGRLQATALVAGYVFANLLNKAFTDRWMFENEEGKRTSVAIGDGDYIGLGKPWVEAFEFGSFLEPEKYPLPMVSRAVSKGASIPVNAIRLFSNSNYFGGPIFEATDSPGEVGYKLFDFTVDAAVPIMFQGPTRYGRALLSGEPATGRDTSVALMRGFGMRVLSPRRPEAGSLADIMAGLGVTPPRDLASALGDL